MKSVYVHLLLVRDEHQGTFSRGRSQMASLCQELKVLAHSVRMISQVAASGAYNYEVEDSFHICIYHDIDELELASRSLSLGSFGIYLVTFIILSVLTED